MVYDGDRLLSCKSDLLGATNTTISHYQAIMCVVVCVKVFDCTSLCCSVFQLFLQTVQDQPKDGMDYILRSAQVIEAI